MIGKIVVCIFGHTVTEVQGLADCLHELTEADTPARKPRKEVLLLYDDKWMLWWPGQRPVPSLHGLISFLHTTPGILIAQTLPSTCWLKVSFLTLNPIFGSDYGKNYLKGDDGYIINKLCEEMAFDRHIRAACSKARNNKLPFKMQPSHCHVVDG